MFIKLRIKSIPVWVNVDHIVDFFEGGENTCYIKYSNGDNVEVQETEKRILEKIESIKQRQLVQLQQVLKEVENVR